MDADWGSLGVAALSAQQFDQAVLAADLLIHPTETFLMRLA
jgi:hypothetical protein